MSLLLNPTRKISDNRVSFLYICSQTESFNLESYRYTLRRVSKDDVLDIGFICSQNIFNYSLNYLFRIEVANVSDDFVSRTSASLVSWCMFGFCPRDGATRTGFCVQHESVNCVGMSQ